MEELAFLELQAAWENAFPNAPFDISLDADNFDDLDKIFTEEPAIFIKDDRIQTLDASQNFKDYNTRFTVVRSFHNQPITLRRIIDTMIRDPHYNKFLLDHHFLEGFDKINNNVFSPFFGS